jgi:chromosome segregation ATPase
MWDKSMSENIENLLLEHLKQFQATLSRIDRRQEEVVTRLGRLEVAVAGLRRDIAHAEEGSAEQGVRIDHLAERVERIERRLELAP